MMSRLISRPASLRNLPPRHRLQISDRSQGKGLRPGQFGNVVPSQSGMGGADRRGEAGFGAQRIAAGDEGEIVGAAAQLVDEVGDQIVEPAGFADQADQRLAGHGFWRGEDSGFDAQHPFAPAGGGRQVGELDVEAFVSAPLATAGSGAHRPYSRNVGRPGKFARGAEHDEAVEQPAGGAVGHRRVAGRFGRRDAILGEQEVDDFLGRFRAQFGRDGEEGFGAAGKIGGEVEGGGGGERDRACGGVWPGWVARPWPSSGARGSQGRIQKFRQRSAARAAASAAGWR